MGKSTFLMGCWLGSRRPRAGRGLSSVPARRQHNRRPFSAYRAIRAYLGRKDPVATLKKFTAMRAGVAPAR